MTITVKHFPTHTSVTATPYEYKQALPNVHRLNRAAYTLGLMQPNYPVPAIQYDVKFHGLDTPEPWFFYSVTWERLNDYEPILCAIVDMNFDRAMDLGHPYGEFHQFD